jgi:rubredoxin
LMLEQMGNIRHNMSARQGVSRTQAGPNRNSKRSAVMADAHLAPNGKIPQDVLCRVCGATKPIGDYYPRQVRACQTVGECKECTKTRVRRRSRTNPAVQAYERERAKTPHRREHLANVARRWNAANPVAYKAHYLVGNAVRDGRISREPCLFCGVEKVHAHHRDYSKPLDVIWLCPKCHHRLHKYFPETEAAAKGPAN